MTSRELRRLVEDDDFRADLDAILNGTTPPAHGQAAPPQRTRASQPRAQAQSQADRQAPEPPPEATIFDKIAENMRFATAYELAPVNLEQRFDSFEKRKSRRRVPVAPAQARAKQAEAPDHAAPGTKRGAAPAEDRANGAAPTGPRPGDPPRPATLRAYSETERIATFGDPTKDPDAWTKANLTVVEVPQLAGTPGADGSPGDGKVRFHRLGARSLGDLFAAWELAGLIDRVQSFDAAHAATSPHPDRNGTDAHAWGIAFDVNAATNPPGTRPTGHGEPGSVRELVAIANRHGFVWGGHDARRPHGAHFELGQRT